MWAQTWESDNALPDAALVTEAQKDTLFLGVASL
jgi:hypothetical protein